jgi:hypothetical protein
VSLSCHANVVGMHVKLACPNEVGGWLVGWSVGESTLKAEKGAGLEAVGANHCIVVQGIFEGCDAMTWAAVYSIVTSSREKQEKPGCRAVVTGRYRA